MRILLVSGFLGAGKTTFIKELAKNINLEFVVLENEYADIGVDGDFLDEKNLNVWEMSEGCICCSMKGDFKSSIKRIYSEINPEYLIIEPTGVGMLSSIIENIREINNNLEIITDDYRNFQKEWFGEILNKSIDNKIIDKNFSLKTHINLRTFSKENVNLKTMDELGLFLNKLVDGDFGKIYRAKGIVKVDGYWGKFNLVYKNFEMEPVTNAKETKIVIIGNNLDVENLKNI